METNKKQVELRLYTINELAAMYKVTRQTIRGWIKRHHKEIGPRTGRYYLVRQVKIIFEEFGVPDGFDDV